MYTPPYPSYIKVGLEGLYISWTCFPDDMFSGIKKAKGVWTSVSQFSKLHNSRMAFTAELSFERGGIKDLKHWTLQSSSYYISFITLSLVVPY